jgi:hypothetical protein
MLETHKQNLAHKQNLTRKVEPFTLKERKMYKLRLKSRLCKILTTLEA